MGKGVVAILWHMSLNNNISILDIDSDRICGIQYKVSSSMYIYFSGAKVLNCVKFTYLKSMFSV